MPPPSLGGSFCSQFSNCGKSLSSVLVIEPGWCAHVLLPFPASRKSCFALFGSQFITCRASPFVFTLFPCLSLMLVKCLSLTAQGCFAELNQTSTVQLQTLFARSFFFFFSPLCSKESSKCLLPLAGWRKSMCSTELFRRNVIIFLFYLLAWGFLLFKKKGGGGQGERDKGWRAPVYRWTHLITLDSYFLCWIFRQVKQSPCWINASCSGTARLFPEAGLTKEGWSGGVGEGERRLLTEGKVFWKKILLWFGRCRVGAVAFCWEIVNWLISSPVPPCLHPYWHINKDGVTESWGHVQTPAEQRKLQPYLVGSWSAADNFHTYLWRQKRANLQNIGEGEVCKMGRSELGSRNVWALAICLGEMRLIMQGWKCAWYFSCLKARFLSQIVYSLNKEEICASKEPGQLAIWHASYYNQKVFHSGKVIFIWYFWKLLKKD